MQDLHSWDSTQKLSAAWPACCKKSHASPQWSLTFPKLDFPKFTGQNPRNVAASLTQTCMVKQSSGFHLQVPDSNGKKLQQKIILARASIKKVCSQSMPQKQTKKRSSLTDFFPVIFAKLFLLPSPYFFGISITFCLYIILIISERNWLNSFSR